ncbi:hypothetical protein ZWY2020_054226 [Hordeum vulgare]|nr:hypothetical protein ZWY2020_054226 [Hordeum vulgare]
MGRRSMSTSAAAAIPCSTGSVALPSSDPSGRLAVNVNAAGRTDKSHMGDAISAADRARGLPPAPPPPTARQLLIPRRALIFYTQYQLKDDRTLQYITNMLAAAQIYLSSPVDSSTSSSN